MEGTETGTDTRAEPRRRRGWVLLVLLVVACYVPVLDAPYLADDHRLFARPLTGSGHGLLQTNERYMRPLPALTMRGEHLLWGTWTVGAHVTNLLLHVLTTLLVGALARRLTGDRAVALCSAVLFGLHPIHAGAVSWLSARFDLFCALLGLSALLKLDDFLARGRRRDLTLSLGAASLALLSKEAAVAFFPTLLLWAWLRRGCPRGSGWWSSAPFGLALVLYLLLRSWVIDRSILDGTDLSREALADGLVSALHLLALPRDRGQWGSWAGPLSTTLAGLVGVTLTLGAVTSISRGSLCPSRGLLFGVGFLLLALVPLAPVLHRLVDGVPPTRVLYTASVGYCLVVGLALGRLRPALRAPLLAGWVLLNGAGLLGNNLAWRRAGELAEHVLARVEALGSGSGERLAAILVQDVPRHHNGAYVFLGAELQHAVRSVLGGGIHIAVVNERRSPLRAIDLRLPARPEAWAGLRWDPELAELVDVTDELRAGMAASRDAADPGRTWRGRELVAWNPGPPCTVDEGGLTLRAGNQPLILQCPPLPASALELKVRVTLRPVDGSPPSPRVVARWFEEAPGPDAEPLLVDGRRLKEGDGFEFRLSAPRALRLEDLQWETLRVRLAFRMEGYEVHVESIRLLTAADGSPGG